VRRKQASPTMQLDNDQVRITRWDFDIDAETGWHTHEMDYIVVQLKDGVLTAESPEGNSTNSELKLGVCYAREAGVTHNMINSSNSSFSFVEIELKNRSK